MTAKTYTLSHYGQTATFTPGYFVDGTDLVYDPTTRRPRIGDIGESMTRDQARATWVRLRKLGFTPSQKTPS